MCGCGRQPQAGYSGVAVSIKFTFDHATKFSSFHKPRNAEHKNCPYNEYCSVLYPNMDMDIKEGRSPSPSTTIQSSTPSTMPPLVDLPSVHYSGVDAVFKAIENAAKDDEDALAITGSY